MFTSNYTHVAFSVSSESLKIYRQDLKLWQENTSKGDSLYILDPDNHKLKLHVGDWQTRLAAIQKNLYEDMIFFD